ncbi:hypothetical protein YC2023_061450 [Brassica napus]
MRRSLTGARVPYALNFSMLTENHHYIQQPHFKTHLSEDFSFKNPCGMVHQRALDGRKTYIFLVDGGLRRRSPVIVEPVLRDIKALRMQVLT